MKMLFASDSFKGSLTAVEICDLLQEAAADIFPDAETVSLPIADGGAAAPNEAYLFRVECNRGKDTFPSDFVRRRAFRLGLQPFPA